MTALEDKFSVPHIRQDGARFHVHSYSLVTSRKRPWENFALSWCSEPFCETNLSEVKKAIEEEHDPANLCHCVAAKEWLRSKAGRAAISAVKRG